MTYGRTHGLRLPAPNGWIWVVNIGKIPYNISVTEVRGNLVHGFSLKNTGRCGKMIMIDRSNFWQRSKRIRGKLQYDGEIMGKIVKDTIHANGIDRKWIYFIDRYCKIQKWWPNSYSKLEEKQGCYKISGIMGKTP